MEAAQKMMLGAQAHQRASAYCFDNPNARAPSIDGLFFPAVSFELILNSIEQSLRLLLLIHYAVRNATHNIWELHQQLRNKSLGKEGIRTEIVDQVNTLLRDLKLDDISETDISKCLRKHNRSYSSFRYFGLDDHGRSTFKWEIKPYELQVLHCLALVLIQVNFGKMKRLGIAPLAMRKVEESDRTNDLQELMVRMKEPSMR